MITKTKEISFQKKSTQQKIFFPNLDGLRFLAFFSVFMFHSFYTEYDYIHQSQAYQLINGLCSNGDLGVNFFFVLSGFLITYLLLNEESLNQKINIPYFYLRRFFRIWPLYFFCMFFGFVLFPLFKSLLGQVPQETANPFLFMTFLSNINNIRNGLPDASILGVLWSVAIEEQFYLFWPLLMVLLKGSRPLLFATVILFSVIFRYFNHDNNDVIYFHTFSVISDMAVGGFLGWFCFTNHATVKYLSRANGVLIAVFYLTGLLLIIFREDIFIGAFGIAIERVILSLFFAFIIFEQNYAQHSLFKIGTNKWLSQWGKYTYGLYCLHFIGILTATNMSKILGTNTTVFGVLIWETCIALSITMILSWLSYHCFEKYFLNAKENFALT